MLFPKTVLNYRPHRLEWCLASSVVVHLGLLGAIFYWQTVFKTQTPVTSDIPIHWMTIAPDPQPNLEDDRSSPNQSLTDSASTSEPSEPSVNSSQGSSKTSSQISSQTSSNKLSENLSQNSTIIPSSTFPKVQPSEANSARTIRDKITRLFSSESSPDPSELNQSSVKADVSDQPEPEALNAPAPIAPAPIATLQPEQSESASASISQSETVNLSATSQPPAQVTSGRGSRTTVAPPSGSGENRDRLDPASSSPAKAPLPPPATPAPTPVPTPPPTPLPTPVPPPPEVFQCVSCPPPAHYPQEARLSAHSGSVQVILEVHPQGYVISADVGSSSGSAILDQTALDTAKTWQFTPTTQGRSGVPVYVDFKLE